MTSSIIPNFHYHDLLEGEIRLVDLHPGRLNEPLRCSLRTVHLLTPPPYEGLSYTWGDDPRSEHLECDSAVIKITPSLYRALPWLRNETDPRTLWIDQVCLDQTNDSEKSSQIPLMPQIFSKADRVLVWLGNEDSETELAFQNIRDAGIKVMNLNREGKLFDKRPGKITQEGLLDLQLTPNTASEWVAYRNLLKRPWFSRVWTYEEIVLSREARILCGSKSISWSEFVTIYGTLTFVNNSLPGNESYLIDDTGIMSFMFFGNQLTHTKSFEPSSASETGRVAYETSHDLLNLVKNLRGNHTKHPMDKIYGILGVAKDLDDLTPKVDVTVDFRTTYSEFTKWFINRYNDLSVLKLVDINAKFDKERQNPDSLPSWTPDYRHYDSLNNMLVENGPKLLHHGSSRFYNATLASKAYAISEDTNRLTLRGIFIGKIVQISEPAGNLVGNVAIGPRVLTGGEWFQLAANCFPNGIYNPTNEPIELAYARTRAGDHFPGEQTIFDRQRRASLMKESGKLTDFPEPGTVTLDAAGDGLVHIERDDIGSSILRYTTRRRLYITDTGYMGVCHRSCRKGDEIYLLIGGDMPFVLRKLGADHFGFKGESYLHGVMDGELLMERSKQMELRQGIQERLSDIEGEDMSTLHTEEIILI